MIWVELPFCTLMLWLGRLAGASVALLASASVGLLLLAGLAWFAALLLLNVRRIGVHLAIFRFFGHYHFLLFRQPRLMWQSTPLTYDKKPSCCVRLSGKWGFGSYIVSYISISI